MGMTDSTMNMDKEIASVKREWEHGHNYDEHHDHDVKHVFKHNFHDEIQDSNEYCKLAKEAEEAGKTKLAEGLYAMAYDEYTHAKFIHDNLTDWNYQIPEKELTEYHELKERIHRIFHK